LTEKTQPAQSWAAPVRRHTSDTLRAPLSTAAAMCPEVTTAQWQTITPVRLT